MSTTESVLFARLQRRLRTEGLQLRRCRLDSRDLSALGRFYVTDPDLNAVAATDVDLSDWLADGQGEPARLG
ncbi:MAG: hypothetical protein ACKOGI_07365 [Vulcanococcus sp.]